MGLHDNKSWKKEKVIENDWIYEKKEKNEKKIKMNSFIELK